MKVLICDPIHKDGIRILREAGLEVDYMPKIEREELKKVIAEYDGIIVRSRTKVDAEVLSRAARLKVIGRAGVGVDNIDVEEAERRGIKVLRTPEGPSVSVAELTVALMLCLARMIPYADRAMKEGRWVKGELMGVELRGKKLGIVGFGRIGYEVAKRAKAFEMEVLVYDVVLDKLMDRVREVGARGLSFEELLRESDFVSIHVPLTPQTRRMIGEEELKAMKPTAYLINTSRGGVVDEGALLRALKEGWIAGAALDVYEVEPPTNMELIRLPNVVCTPHIGAQTAEAQRRNSVLIANKLLNALKHLSWE